VTRPRVYLDTNVSILAFETGADAGEPARPLLTAIEDGVVDAVTSEPTLAELLVKPMRDGDAALAEVYRTMIAAGARFTVAPVDRPVLELAAGERARHAALKLPDAIRLASAIRSECTVVASCGRALAPFSDTIRVCALDSEAIHLLTRAAE